AIADSTSAQVSASANSTESAPGADSQVAASVLNAALSETGGAESVLSAQVHLNAFAVEWAQPDDPVDGIAELEAECTEATVAGDGSSARQDAWAEAAGVALAEAETHGVVVYQVGITESASPQESSET